MYYEDSLKGVIEFCEGEGQPCESVVQLMTLFALMIPYASEIEKLDPTLKRAIREFINRGD